MCLLAISAIAALVIAVLTPKEIPDQEIQLAEVPAWSVTNATPNRVAEEFRKLFEIEVTVTAYSSTVDQTDDTPFITASNTRVRRGIIALSRDLLREYTPGAPFEFGDVVEIPGVGNFFVEDTMNKRYTKRADIWFEHRADAYTWGRQNRSIIRHVGDRENGVFEPEALEPSHSLLFEEALSD
ncbi:MAG: 3D domain-containing protein [Candidatus Eisenbacteria bacterium]|uniref:3D domain-containing protein n=1 Tax=Eiseniibacteriota bacterium TaxID=2212470 RepID=A0A7Y2H1I2_UNCEI|nr:3D domain-containing protein [Candidatus Eisenbacteria bacterium]